MKRVKIDQLEDKFFDYAELGETSEIQEIISGVKERGDDALREFTLQFDGVKIDQFKIGKEEIEKAYSFVSKDLTLNINRSADNLRKFSERQLEAFRNFEYEIEPGALVSQKVIPIKRVGVYVPGGRYPLISSVIMGVIPAKIAGVEEVVVCSPPSHRESIHPAILVTADICGVDEINKVGGAQAVAAMAYGTQSIECVDKIVGPGNVYVNAAKKIVYGRVGIDFIAGPTEVLIIADKDANPAFIAADLIAQAEHDVSAKPILVTDSDELSSAVLAELEKQLRRLKGTCVAEKSLRQNGILIIVSNMDEAIELANRKAPEHIQLSVEDPEFFLPRLRNYGSLFIGEDSPEVLGDYCSGLNHILPTNSASRYTGGLSVKDFLKIQTTLKINREGFLRIGPVALSMAEAEGLVGHMNSIEIRL